MTISPNEFIPELDFSLLLKLQKEQYLKSQTKLVFGKRWQLVEGLPLANLSFKGTYNRISKVDLSTLVNYTAEKDHFVNIETLENEEDEIKKCFAIFCEEFAEFYNKEIAKSKKIVLTFPVILQSTSDDFCQTVISDLHAKIQTSQNPD